jgi:hypothetical protein
MKTLFTPILIIASLFSVIIFSGSCAKPDHSTDLPKEQQVVGKWSINRIQLKIYTGGAFIKDTIVPQNHYPNYVQFDAAGGFEYKFDASSPDVGTYQFVGADSLISTSSPNNYRWKMLTLTSVLFTVMNTTTDPAYPGSVVERYQTFVR